MELSKTVNPKRITTNKLLLKNAIWNPDGSQIGCLPLGQKPMAVISSKASLAGKKQSQVD